VGERGKAYTDEVLALLELDAGFGFRLCDGNGSGSDETEGGGCEGEDGECELHGCSDLE